MSDTTADHVTPAVDCPSCGAPVVAGDRFCESCGTDLPASVVGDGPRPPTGRDDATDATPAPVACAECGGTFEQGWCTTCGARAPEPRDHLEESVPGVAGVTDRGRVHRRNEDAMAIRRAGGTAVGVVADGVSSTTNPQVASAAAAAAAADHLANSGDLLDAHRAAQEAAAGVDAAVDPDRGPASTTLLLAAVTDHDVSVASLGDCRAYWVTDDVVTQVTTDDSWAHDQVAEGRMTEEQAMRDPRAHVITRWLGADADPDWQPEVHTFTATDTGRLLLCSDGLWNELDHPGALRTAVDGLDLLADPPDEVAGGLVQFANDRGGRDNITVVLVEVPPPATVADEPDPSPDPATTTEPST